MVDEPPNPSTHATFRSSQPPGLALDRRAFMLSVGFGWARGCMGRVRGRNSALGSACTTPGGACVHPQDARAPGTIVRKKGAQNGSAGDQWSVLIE